MRRQIAIISCTGRTINSLEYPAPRQKGAYLQTGSQLDLHIGSHRKFLDGYTSPGWLRVLKESLVDLVHGREIGHVGQEDADSDDILHAGSGLFEHGREVLEALSLRGDN